MPVKPGEVSGKTIQPAVARKIRKILLEWGKVNYQNFPWRETSNDWYSLVAEILLQRTRAKNVVSVYNAFISRYPDPGTLASSSKDEVKAIIQPLGLPWRAKYIFLLGKELSTKEIPVTYEGIVMLPCVGDYVASAFFSLHGKKRAILVDANTVRWLCRFLDQEMDGETRRKKWLRDCFEVITPHKKWKEFNFSLLDFSMTICNKKPICNHCLLSELCCYEGKLL
jgi:A/G-specific adenine glycosylase